MNKEYLRRTDGSTFVFTNPEKGIDYWTEADQEAIVQQVITALGTPVFGRVDADNNIILTGELANGTYTLKYEDAEGNVIEIGTLEQGASYKNFADPNSSDWLKEQRLNSTGEIKPATGAHATNYIPVKKGEVVRVRGLNILYYDSSMSYSTVHFYDINKVRVGSISSGGNPTDFGVSGSNMAQATDFAYTVGSGNVSMVSGDGSNIAYIRFSGMLCAGYTLDDVIITVNQEIPEEEPAYTNLLNTYLVGRDVRFSQSAGASANWQTSCPGMIMVAIPFNIMMEKTLRIQALNIAGQTLDGKSTNFNVLSNANAFKGYMFNEGNASLDRATCAVNEGNNTYSFFITDENVTANYDAGNTMYASIVVNTTGTAVTDEELAQVVITIDEPIV